MKVTVATLSDQIFSLEISEDLELENFKAFCEVESGIPTHEIVIVHHGRPLTDDSKSLKNLGLKDGDVVILQQHHRPSSSSLLNNRTPSLSAEILSQTQVAPGSAAVTQFDFGSIQIPSSSMKSSGGKPPNPSNNQQQQQGGPNSTSTSQNLNFTNPAVIRDILSKDPKQLQQLEQNNPELAAAFKSGDFDKFSKLVRELQAQAAERERQRRLMLSAEPFDVEAQRLIAEEIRQKNIDANMEAAIEFNPESFATVIMLYINCKVNGHPVKAFIDSGAQTTIMSTDCAERCNLMRLVDVRFSGIAKGVGVQRIIGRIHMVQIQIDKDFLTSSFSILEDQKMDMLLGLDMLKRHQCVIDLNRNVLVIGTTGTETPFLTEADLPDMAKLTGDSKTQLPTPAENDGTSSSADGGQLTRRNGPSSTSRSRGRSRSQSRDLKKRPDA